MTAPAYDDEEAPGPPPEPPPLWVPPARCIHDQPLALCPHCAVD